MIYIIFGTVAEYIKLFPVMKQFDRHHIRYIQVDTGQQIEAVRNNINRLDKKKPEFTLTSRKKNVENIPQILVWMVEVLFNARRLPINNKDLVIVLGCAAMPTLLGFIIGKFFRAKLIHIESGKRTFNYLNPFPEEIISAVVSRFSDICFPADHVDALNLSFKKNVYETHGNTVIDATKEVLKFKPSLLARKYSSKPFVLFIARRHENIIIKNNLEKIINILEIILKKKYRVLWPAHTTTEHALKERHFWKRIVELSNTYPFVISNLFDYVDFIYLLSRCEFVATDASGAQEEAYFLNKPTLILRNHSPNPGIGETGMLSNLDHEKVNIFLKTYKKFKRTKHISGNPSKIILEVFKKQLL